MKLIELPSRLKYPSYRTETRPETGDYPLRLGSDDGNCLGSFRDLPLFVRRSGAVPEKQLAAAVDLARQMKADAESTARGHASALAEGRLRADHIQARFKVAPSGDLDCRQIQWLGYHEAGLAGALAPPLQAALSFFREHFSEQFKRQTEFAFHHHLPAGFLGSCFNEAALEFNLPSFALHRDNIVYDNDWVAAVVVLKSPPHDASDLVFPEFGVGVELRAGDVALYRAKALHGFTPLDESAASTDRIDLCFGGICRPLESDF